MPAEVSTDALGSQRPLPDGTLSVARGAQLPKSGDTDADAILDGRVDASIVYCSGRDRYARLLPDATLVMFPPELRVGPEYGLAVLKDADPAAAIAPGAEDHGGPGLSPADFAGRLNLEVSPAGSRGRMSVGPIDEGRRGDNSAGFFSCKRIGPIAADALAFSSG